MYALPSTSKMREPSPRAMKRGVAAHAAKGAHGRIDAARNELLGAANNSSDRDGS